MVGNRLSQGIVTFVLTAAIARTLGASSLGQYLLAISYFYIFVNIASQGLKTLLTREVAREPELTSVYLVNGSLLQFFLCIIAYVALVIWVFLLPYSPETSLVCYITGLTVIPFGLSNITESILQGEEKMHLIAFSTVPVYILRLLVMIGIMSIGYGIEYVVGILVISEIVILLVQWFFIIRVFEVKWQIRSKFIWDTIKKARTFFAIEGIGIIAAKIDILMLSLLGSETLIGIFGAVTQLLQPFFIISGSISLAGFPRLSKSVSLGIEKQRETAQNIIEILLCMALPLLVGLLFVGKDLLLLVYKDPRFANETLILNIISILTITSSFSRIFSYLLLANGFERLNLLEVVITTTVASFAGIFLISQYQLIGAALMALIMSFTSFIFRVYVVYTRLFSVQLWKVFRIPLLISIFMSSVFLLLKQIQIEFYIQLILAISAYCLFSGVILVIKSGGIKNAWELLRTANK
ncbi:oligosaccharide flippase family protein [Nodularia sphaerocarpa]|nr:oligosaccharide flippase family protein [Nodularia sphaerocarpa]